MATVQQEFPLDDLLSRITGTTEPLPGERALQLQRIGSAADTLLAERSLYEFSKQAWHVIEPETAFIDNWHIADVCDHLQSLVAGNITRLIINMPPRTMKSILSSVAVQAWTWIHWPACRYITTSYSQSLAIRDAVKTRDILRSRWYRERWASDWQLKIDMNVKSRYENTQAGFRMAASTGSSVTGEGADVLTSDDPINVRDAPSKLIRDKVNYWWDKVMSTRLNNPKTGRKLITMQRTHEDDLTGHCLAQGGYYHLCIPMTWQEKKRKVTTFGWTDPRTEEGDLLCPERVGPNEVAELKAQLGSQASGQLEQDPTPDEGDILKAKNFRYYKVRKIPFSDLTEQEKKDRKSDTSHLIVEVMDDPDKFEPTRRFLFSDCFGFQTVDTAMKTGKENDFTAVSTFIITPDHDLVIWRMDQDKVSVPEQYGWIVSRREVFPWLAFQAVEDKQSGTGLIQQAAKDGKPFKILTADVDKIRRSVNLATLYENGKVFHPVVDAEHPAGDTSAWLGVWEGQALAFPNGLHDDLVDTASYAGNITIERAATGVGIRSLGDGLTQDQLRTMGVTVPKDAPKGKGQPDKPQSKGLKIRQK